MNALNGVSNNGNFKPYSDLAITSVPGNPIASGQHYVCVVTPSIKMGVHVRAQPALANSFVLSIQINTSITCGTTEYTTGAVSDASTAV